ncbi:MAG: D-2-hydroxyacid dehydrogenase [Chloroflexi bacterium]|nr:D-2-hydroxyacid dehydrogenase [Chloroflexota bacterium]MBV9596813.1 D-2-hydroxyacid dehydrogenase [Chloroflexota bacterium]
MKMLVLSPFQRDPDRLAKIEQEHGMQFIVPARGEPTAPLIAEVEAVYGMLGGDDYPHAKKLRWVQSPSAGVEWMWRVPGLQDSDVTVTNMRGAHAATIAEHTFAFLLTHTRALRAYEEHQREHKWGRGELAMSGLKGRTMGIIGFGNIGRAIARRATGFEMRVLAVDAEPVPPGEGVEEVWPLDRLNDLCRESDVLVISAPMTPTSRNMVKAEQIRHLKRGSYILQMSRGAIVNEAALVDALEEGHLAGAGLDVTETEPLPVGDPLWTAPNLIVTPHSSASSQLTTDLAWSILSENVGRYMRGETLMNLVDKKRGW